VALTPLSVPTRVKANGVCGPLLLMNPYLGSGSVVAAKSTSTSTVVSLTCARVTVPTSEGWTPAKAGGFFEERLERPEGSINDTEANEMRRRHGWEIVGPPPF
jgi:hypothetical protein